MASVRTWVRRFFLWGSLVFFILAAAALTFIYSVGAWNLLFPSSDYDTVAPTLPATLADPAVLVFSKTNSFRHSDGIEGGQRALQSIAQQQGWSVYLTENGAIFNPNDLSKFSAVVFLNATGDMLSEMQKMAFQQWLQAGGGWLGVHAAGDSSHLGWPWYMENLIGATFIGHIMGPQFQSASVLLEDQHHPATQNLMSTWEHEEEWYSWDKSPRANGFHILATLDESSYTPKQILFGNSKDLHMGDHPVLWSNCVEQGRALYTAMGHTAESFEQPWLRAFLTDGLRWTMGLTPLACEAMGGADG